MNEIGKRPWGEYEVLLNAESCKVKRITVNPKQRLSYQYHDKRDESWTVVVGQADVTLDGEVKILRPGQNITIKRGQRHRVENTQDDHDLVFIEVQTGDYFGEDDIVRLSDDYGRKS